MEKMTDYKKIEKKACNRMVTKNVILYGLLTIWGPSIV